MPANVVPTNAETSTIVSILPGSNEVIARDLTELELPIEEFSEEEDQGVKIFSGLVWHRTDSFWHESIRPYKSGYCGSSVLRSSPYAMRSF